MHTEFLVRIAWSWAILLTTVFLPSVVHAYTIHAPEVKVSTASGTMEESFFAFDAKFTGGGRVASGDIDGDGVSEIVVGAGLGGGPNVRIFEQDGTVIGSFFAYDEKFRGGIFVSTGDINGDGVAEIITGAGIRGGPDVRIFSRTGERLKSFLAYDEKFRGGVLVAAGDLTGDGIDEIVTGSGPGGRSHVRVFDGSGTFLGLDFWPFTARESGGTAVAVGNVVGDEREEIVASIFTAGRAEVKVYGYESTRPIYGHFFAYPASYQGGVSLGAANVAGDAHEEILTVPTIGAAHVRGFTVNGESSAVNFFPYPKGFRGGAFVSGIDTTEGEFDRVLSIPGNGTERKRPELARYIETDLSEQRLYAYEYGVLVKTFLVSTGVRGWDTPKGTFAVSAKIPVKLYAGPGYYLPNTKWNLRYDGPRYLHGAYWHNDFGRTKSHGCINIAYPNAEWLYRWASVGTTVVVKD